HLEVVTRADDAEEGVLEVGDPEFKVARVGVEGLEGDVPAVPDGRGGHELEVDREVHFLAGDDAEVVRIAGDDDRVAILTVEVAAAEPGHEGDLALAVDRGADVRGERVVEQAGRGDGLLAVQGDGREVGGAGAEVDRGADGGVKPVDPVEPGDEGNLALVVEVRVTNSAEG